MLLSLVPNVCMRSYEELQSEAARLLAVDLNAIVICDHP